MDDILDVEGDPAVMGKPAGSDAGNLKMTFPSLMGLERFKTICWKHWLRRQFEALDLFDEKKTLPLRAIAEYILERKR